MLRKIHATRYVTPLKEGGSLPAIVEADDLGLYVVKIRGAGQGPLALVAEIIAGEIGLALGLRVPEIVFAQVDEALGRNEPDPEIYDLLKASVGLNVAIDFLPGSVMFDIAAGDKPSPETASQAVWFDAFVSNVDRTARNANILCWHRQMYFIDHGAALYFHHNWGNTMEMAQSRFQPVRNHILLPWASQLEEVNQQFVRILNDDLFVRIMELVPQEWITQPREDYVQYFIERRNSSANFLEEAIRARTNLV
jgi:hypothetical protein